MYLKRNFGHIGTTQSAVIKDILLGMSKYEILEKHKVSPSRYHRWLKNPVFRKALEDRIDDVKRQQKYISLNSLPKAAERLAKLITSEKDEVARKACLDIINLQKTDASQQNDQEDKDENVKNKALPVNELVTC